MVLGRQFDDDFDVTVHVGGTEPTQEIPQDALNNIDKMRSIARKRPLPKDIEVKHDTVHGYLNRTTFNDKEGRIIGSVRWDPTDGNTDKITMPYGHTQYLPHLMSAAWDRAESEGQYGPGWAHRFSPKGERLMNKVNPNSSVLPWATVETSDNVERPFRTKKGRG